jgi:hypothetical protein
MKSIIKRKLVAVLLVIGSFAFAQNSVEKAVINDMLTKWHEAAAEANFDTYFEHMTSDGVFIGTDATENWQNKAFKEFSKPYFDKGKAWSFNTLERHVYLDAKAGFAWFDELLDTQMKICRGSGVLKKIKGEWKIKHYVLSMTVPNENVNEVVAIKSVLEDKIINNSKLINSKL